MSKLVTLFDPQGQSVDVPQERVVPLMRSGFSAKGGQTVTLGDEKHTEIPIERLATGLSQGMNPIIESSEGRFKREAEQQYGGFGGAAKGFAYGGLQAATLGLGGKGLMAAGLASPEDLAKLQEAQGGAIFGGEMATGLALAPFTGGASVGEAAGVAAAKTLGRKVAESAGREALIGAGYGVGSEVTQAGIEGREANLGQAAAGGATAGGLLGAAVPVVGAAAGRAAERKAAAQGARAEAAAAEAAPLTNYEAKRAAIREQSTAIANEANDLLSQRGFLEETLGGENVNKVLRREQKTLEDLTRRQAKAMSDFAASENVEPFRAGLEDIHEMTSGLQTEFAKRQVQLTSELNGLMEKKQALSGMPSASKSAIQGLDSKIDALHGQLDTLAQNQEHLGTLARGRAVGASLGEQVADNQKLKSEFAKIAEREAELGGAGTRDAVAASKAAADEAAAGARPWETVDLGIASNAAASPYIPRAAWAAGQNLDDMRAVARDLMAVEHEGGTGRSSYLYETFKHPEMLDRMTPENAAYLKALAGNARELKLVRSKGSATRLSNLGEMLSDRAGQIAPEVEDQLAAMAREDVVASRAVPADEVNAIRTRYEQAGKLEVTAAPVRDADIAGNTPAETVAIRTTLAEQEPLAAELDKASETLAKRSMSLADEEKTLQAAARKAKSPSEQRAAQESLANVQANKRSAQTAADEINSFKQGINETRAAIRENRALNAEAVADLRERAAAAKNAVKSAERLAKRETLSTEYEQLTSKKAAQESLVDGLQALKAEINSVDNRIAALERQGGSSAFIKLQNNQRGALDADRLFDKNWQAFLKTPEGRSMHKAMEEYSEKAGAMFGNPDKVMGMLGVAEMAHGVFGGGLMSGMLGAFMAAKSGKTGLAKAAATLMNPVPFWNGVSRAMTMMERGSIPTGRTMAVNKGYTFSVPAANAYVDAILKDRQAANDAFDSLVKSGGINPAEIQNARQRFDAAVDYLERKRPATSNGADAQAFARSVALLRNPDLLAKFVHDGSLRQQDVDVLQLVSPEAYEQLKSAVQLLQEKKPDMAMNLAPLFKLMSKMKVSARGGGGLSLAMAQSLIGAAPSSQGPMVPGAEAAAARARPGKESSLVESTKL